MMNSCWIIPGEGVAGLEFRRIAIPEPGPGEVLLRTRASSLNRGELMAGAAGKSAAAKIGGMDAAGVIEKRGVGVAGFAVGDEVCGRVTGGWAEFCIARADQLMPKPGRLGWEQAAAIGVAWLTAYELIFPPYGKLKAGETLLVAGASSGVGVAAVQIARELGARVIGTSGSLVKLERLAKEGLDHGIHTRQPDFAAEVRSLTAGAGADLAINLIGGSVFAELLRSLARKGRLGIVGYLDGVLEATLDLAALHANRLEIFGISNGRLPPGERAGVMRGFLREVWPMLEDGRIIPRVDKVFPWDELPAAKAYLESAAGMGKVVVKTCQDGQG